MRKFAQGRRSNREAARPRPTKLGSLAGSLRVNAKVRHKTANEQQTTEYCCVHLTQ